MNQLPTCAAVLSGQRHAGGPGQVAQTVCSVLRNDGFSTAVPILFPAGARVAAVALCAALAPCSAQRPLLSVSSPSSAPCLISDPQS